MTTEVGGSVGAGWVVGVGLGLGVGVAICEGIEIAGVAVLMVSCCSTRMLSLVIG